MPKKTDKGSNLSPKEQWWHVDSKGRKIGYMWPEDFKMCLDSIWGNRKGIGGFAKYSGFSRTTVEFYCNGKSPVPQHVALLAAALVKLVPFRSGNQPQTAQAKTRNFPRLTADWLPNPPEKRKLDLAKRPFG